MSCRRVGLWGAARDRFRPRLRNRRSAGRRRPDRRSIGSRRARLRKGRRTRSADRREAPRCGGRPPRDRRAAVARISSFEAPTQVRCAAGFIVVSRTRRSSSRMGAFAGRPAGAVGHRDEGGVQRLEPGRRLPQVRLHLRAFWAGRTRTRPEPRVPARLRGTGFAAIRRTPRRSWGIESEMIRGSSAIHSATVSLPASPAAGGTRSERTLARPASARKPSTSCTAKPSRRWANSSRRNSWSWASKSTSASRPPGRQRPRRLAKRARRIVEEVQHLVDDDQVVGVALDRRGVDVALAQLRHCAGPPHRCGCARAPASPRSGRRRRRGPRAGASSSSMRPVPVPRSSRLRNGFVADHGEQRRLDPFLRRVQGADVVPVGSLLGEIGRGLPAPGLARDFEPGAVGG